MLESSERLAGEEEEEEVETVYETCRTKEAEEVAVVDLDDEIAIDLADEVGIEDSAALVASLPREQRHLSKSDFEQAAIDFAAVEPGHTAADTAVALEIEPVAADTADTAVAELSPVAELCCKLLGCIPAQPEELIESSRP